MTLDNVHKHMHAKDRSKAVQHLFLDHFCVGVRGLDTSLMGECGRGLFGSIDHREGDDISIASEQNSGGTHFHHLLRAQLSVDFWADLA